MRSRLDRARRLQQRQLAAQPSFFSRSSSTISDAFHSATNARRPSFDSCQRNRIRRRHRIALGQIETMLDVLPSPDRSAAHRQTDCRPPAISPHQHVSNHRNGRRKRHSLVPIHIADQLRLAPGASCCSGRRIIRSGSILPSAKRYTSTPLPVSRCPANRRPLPSGSVVTPCSRKGAYRRG